MADSIDRPLGTQPGARLQRTTIVPQPLEELDSDPTCIVSPLRMADCNPFELDDPAHVDPEFFETKVREANRSDKPGALSAVAASVSLGDTAERLVLPPIPPSQSTRPPASARPPKIQSESHPEHAKSDKWYLRVQLDTESVADLWIRDRTPHNVLVWSEDMATWVPLLTVRELRDAIRDAHDEKTRDELHDANLVFVNTQAKPVEYQPLPAPRLPASAEPLESRGKSLPTRPPQPASLWSQPKPRTISNVPPPLLTTAVPVLATAATPVTQPAPQQPASPQVTQLQPASPAMSTLPPVVTSLQPEQELRLDTAALPSIPRPARLPDVSRIARMVTAHSPRPLRLPDVGRAKSALARLPLIHVERALWLAAGIAIARAVMLVLRANDHGQSADVYSAAGPLQAPNRVGETTPVNAAATPASTVGTDVHRIEDLPIVSGSALAAARTASSPRERPKLRGRTIAPERVHLASATNTLGPSKATPAAGGFDTGAARRVLTGSASRAGRCTTDGPASGSVLVTFAPSGFVQSASMSGLSGRGVNVACVLRSFQEARVSPFSGGPVTVRKGFQIL